ncbi:HD domain-containing phosphohydrolase [uncultured Thermanaerothrix sp.]|uniref:HD-GYP domain-containing protein n=1 Tax=uncultured Thermanaerothrix sp. TaxID=1195149 RepID=UPI0026016737|nr:HD domain-containing phosphohydrolase [uncultured Thermanaerothrix sp.]
MNARLPDTGELRRLVAESVAKAGFEPTTSSFAPAMPVYEDPLSAALSGLATCVVSVTRTAFCKVVILGGEWGFESRAVAFADGGGHIRRIAEPFYAQRLYRQVIISGHPMLISREQDSLGLDEGRTLRYHDANALLLMAIGEDSSSVRGVLIIGAKQPAHFHDGQLRLAGLLARYAHSLVDYVTHPEARPPLYDDIVMLSKSIELYDLSISQHSMTLVQVAERLAKRLGCLPTEIKTIGLAALLHDLGKVGVPMAILQKPEPLSPEEWVLMRRHPEIGAQIVQMITGLSGVATIIQCHHENFDGSGYPHGLKGYQIPLGSRILAVVDAFEAITGGRVYRPPRSAEAALQEIQRCAGTQFDPQIVEAFVALIKEEGFNASQGE